MVKTFEQYMLNLKNQAVIWAISNIKDTFIIQRYDALAQIHVQVFGKDGKPVTMKVFYGY
jgi:hypothetical protein